MNNKIIFEKIIQKKTSKNIIYQDKQVTAFYDIKPQALVHFLVIPNIYISSLNEITKKNKDIVGYMMYIAIKIAKQLKISDSGYRIVVNCNKNAGQEIKYLHIHVLGGEKLNNIN
ncbi:purine nucleoside phosphoramidase [Buchnera aphidicola (Nipponaphis monzeni)]|uniref:Purine nucleoside phosphoramidase n=1 Tax=Buchnera aphidicola (Nipponaphis monzeni) TaxID=2495405 RepID=A0A455TAF1_9GAMM|nr:histidine triad nucleotide-binding protein [Buchnera aphidicola]BBI01285.1 purine nucleoside phosphoramidase [Buchnera aphidicola (Nipponaphis monzeni)]